MPGAGSEVGMAVSSDLRRAGEVFSSEGYEGLGSLFVMGCSLFTFPAFSAACLMVLLLFYTPKGG